MPDDPNVRIELDEMPFTPKSLVTLLTELSVGQSHVYATVVQARKISRGPIADGKARAANTAAKAISRVRENHPNRVYTSESHHYITDEPVVVVMSIITREK